MNIIYVHRFVLVTDEHIGRPGWLWLALYVCQWGHVTDEYTWLIFIGNMASPKNIRVVGLTYHGPRNVGVFCTGKNRVVKIVCSNSEIVLRTIKHIMIYPGSGPSLELIVLRPVVWYWRWIGVTKGWAESSRSLRCEGGNGSRTPCMKGRWPFIGHTMAG
jgi:hypothetical protein